MATATEEDKKITFKQLVEARKEEMQHMRPGLMTIVTDGEHTVEIESPRAFARSTFKLKEG